MKKLTELISDKIQEIKTRYDRRIEFRKKEFSEWRILEGFYELTKTGVNTELELGLAIHGYNGFIDENSDILFPIEIEYYKDKAQRLRELD